MTASPTSLVQTIVDKLGRDWQNVRGEYADRHAIAIFTVDGQDFLLRVDSVIEESVYEDMVDLAYKRGYSDGYDEAAVAAQGWVPAEWGNAQAAEFEGQWTSATEEDA